MRNDSIDEIRKFVFDWNIRYPIDRWWREKHKIPFNSSDHRVSSFIDQIIEYEEDKMFKEIVEHELEKSKEEYVDDSYVPGNGNFLNKREVTQQEAKDIYDNLNLDNFEFQ